MFSKSCQLSMRECITVLLVVSSNICLDTLQRGSCYTFDLVRPFPLCLFSPVAWEEESTKWTACTRTHVEVLVCIFWFTYRELVCIVQFVFLTICCIHRYNISNKILIWKHMENINNFMYKIALYHPKYRELSVNKLINSIFPFTMPKKTLAPWWYLSC